jgi:hypothetical protein
MADPRAVHLYLEQLASSLLGSGQPLQAVKCLEGLATQSLLPVDEARCRLRVAKLLMGHTLNISEAQQHLLKAVSSPAYQHAERAQQVNSSLR